VGWRQARPAMPSSVAPFRYEGAAAGRAGGRGTGNVDCGVMAVPPASLAPHEGVRGRGKVIGDQARAAESRPLRARPGPRRADRRANPGPPIALDLGGAVVRRPRARRRRWSTASTRKCARR
jgi:hypothetical protein